MMQQPQCPNTAFKPLSVSALNKTVKTLLETAQGQMFIEGEVSNLARPRSGHLYFSLKDDKCQVQCVWLSYQHNPCARTLQEGMQLLVRAKVTLYEARGNYQLLIQHAEEAGLGALQRAYEALKLRLQQQGWFDAKHKQNIPPYPHTIGLITSPTGAAVQDMLSVLKRRYPCANVLIYPCQVQGDQAAPTIIQAIQEANNHGLCSVLLLARGGGNIEDLWAFNREDVAQAIFESTCPIITGIGHEIDTTIADHVADRRAPTPSAAAEAATPERDELMQKIDNLGNQMHSMMTHRLQHATQKLQWLSAKCIHPEAACQLARQRLQPMGHRMQLALKQQQTPNQQNLQNLQQRLMQHDPMHQIKRDRQHLQALVHQCKSSLQHLLHCKHMTMAKQAKALELMSPLHTLSRGYTIVRDPITLKPITEADTLVAQQPLCIQFPQHQVHATITKIQPCDIRNETEAT